MEREDSAADEVFRTRLGPAHSRVTVFHRKGEVAARVGAAHDRVFAWRHPPPQHQALGAAADRAMERTDQNLTRPRRRHSFAAQLGTTGRDVPQRLGTLAQPIVSHRAPKLDLTPRPPLYRGTA